MDTNTFICTNIGEVQNKINQACKRVGRDPKEVTLIAVSKTKPVEYIDAALNTHVRDYGENKVQELCDKYEYFNSSSDKEINWHMIGHLQRNKVKYLVGKVDLIHSVDSLRLANQIETDFSKKNLIADILIEINIAGEESKFGVSPSDAEDLIRNIALLKHVRIRGLMTVAPYTENPENNRAYFRNMHQLLVDINSKNIDNVYMDILSMGMSGDYEIAVEEGATLVRVGTGIFGERNYNI